MSENKQLFVFYAFLKNQGLIWGPEPDETSYEPLPGHYSYGPLGKLFKNKIENYLRSKFNFYDYHEIETPLVYPQSVWEASGHWHKFQDPTISTKSGAIYRLDKLIEEQFPEVNYANLSREEILDYVNRIAPPKDDPFDPNLIGVRNLMMLTSSGSKSCALRPETATATYLAFPNVFRYFGHKLPLKFYQMGKAFRNEISPKQNVIRGREFTQAEAHLALDPKEKNNCPSYLQIQDEVLPLYIDNKIVHHSIKECIESGYFGSQYYAWTIYIAFDLVRQLIPIDRIRLRKHADNEKAFYALDANDIEIKIDHIGWVEIAGIHDRGCYDLTQHKLNTELHCLETAFGVDRLIFALLDVYYDKKELDQGKTMWRIPYHVAPVQISIFPLLKNKKELVHRANEICEMLKSNFAVEYDEKQSIGKRYLKSGTKGVPYCITIDHQTLEDDTVTVRDRNTENQIRIKCSKLLGWFGKNINTSGALIFTTGQTQ